MDGTQTFLKQKSISSIFSYLKPLKLRIKLLYTSQNWDLEDELYEENSFIRMCKKQDVQDELQISKGVTIVI